VFIGWRRSECSVITPLILKGKMENKAMRMGKLLAAVAATSLLATPAMANSASSLSVAKAVNAKASTSAKKSNKLAGDAVVIGVIGAAMAAGAILAVTEDDNDSDSN
jgi:hypothetical protein